MTRGSATPWPTHGPLRVLDIDNLSGSVLDDPLARPGPLALVELTRAILHAYRNPAGLTPDRLRSLAPQFDVLLEQEPPLGSNDVGALWRYIITVFERDSPLCAVIVESVSQKARQMYETIADQLHAEGMLAGRAEALLDVLRHRALPVPEALRTRVLATRDETLLRRWFDRALTVSSTDELFEPAGS